MGGDYSPYHPFLKDGVIDMKIKMIGKGVMSKDNKTPFAPSTIGIVENEMIGFPDFTIDNLMSAMCRLQTGDIERIEVVTESNFELHITE